MKEEEENETMNVGYETQYGISTENDDEVFDAIIDMNFPDVSS